MGRKNLTILLAFAGVLLLFVANGHAYPSRCPDPGSGCTSCHPKPGTGGWPACPAPPPPTCTDQDGDGFSVEGGACGPVDCNDSNPAINPGAAENCTDTIDNNCNNLVDAADGTAVGCPPPCTDGDGDGFAVEGGSCGPVDCNDSNAAINPGAVDIPNNGIDENCSGADSVDPTLLDKDGDGYTPAEGDCNDNNAAINPGAVEIPNNAIDENCDGVVGTDSSIVDNDGDGFTPASGDCDDTDAAVHPGATEICTDTIDNDCNGLVDGQDPGAVDCPVEPTCTDVDGDSYAVEGGSCGPVDCNDSDPGVNPGSDEICGDSIDNDCDSAIDEGCDAACPDADGDGYLDAACGGTDCDDTDAAINPAATEICGNDIDENCNGASDDACTTCPDGSLLEVTEATYDDEELQVEGRGNVGTTLTITDSDGAILADGIRVREGRWQAEIEHLRQAPEWISVITSDGCAVEQEVDAQQDEHHSWSRRHDNDHSDGGSHRTRSRSSRGDH